MAYTPKQVKKAKEKIINKLSVGDSLKAILEKDKDLPSRPIVYEWLNKNHNKFDESFLNNYIRAREDSADLDAEKLEEIAEKTLTGVYDPSSARVAADILKWTAGRKKPKKYGDKLELSGDKDAPLQTVVVYLPDNKRESKD